MNALTVQSIENESEVTLSPDGLSVHIRIPADGEYLCNAVLTLKEICAHISISDSRSNRIILALEESLLNAIEHAYNSDQTGLIDVLFSVDGAEFSLIVEDFGCGIPSDSRNQFSNYEEILCDRGRGLEILHSIPDKIVVDSQVGSGTRATMLFYLEDGS